MKTGNHTQGPWEYSGGGIWAITPWNARVAIANVHFFSSTNGIDQETNGRLLAAAPDLKEALRDMLAGWRYIRESHGDLYGVGWDRAQEKAERALEAATGRPA